MTARIILTTIGSLGDLHPFLAVGKALQARGAHPVMAIPESNIDKAEAAGLEAVAVVPGIERVAADTGKSVEDFMRVAINDAPTIAKTLLLPYFGESFDRINAIADGAEIIAGSSFLFAGTAVAEKRGIPFVAMMLQPLAFLSDYDPPLLWEYPVLARAPKADWQIAWNRVAGFFLRAEVWRRYSFSINRSRRLKGLGPARGLPVLGAPAYCSMSIGMYSSVLGAIQPDFPPNSHLVGFPQFDSDSGRQEALSDELTAFLDAGAPPIVFTLGSIAVLAAGDFYARSREVARRLGRRAVLLTGNDDRSLDAPDCLCLRYAPHSLLFPRAAVNVHHGGIGTTGQALRSGRPQLVVPFMGDQPDNAVRIRRIGAGLLLSSRRYTVDRAAGLIKRLLDEPGFAAEAARLGDVVRAERAAEAAADRLLELAESRRRST
ncbi:MAG: glycosyltransferase [Alphaproteobacteria bacterium]|nr:glycosyltransferase [Alphaproteobacteria bacterium]